jgi:hypothetical protein
MIDRIKHIFTGHNWSDWVIKTYSAYAYDEEIWWERSCECGAVEQQECYIDGWREGDFNS